MRADQIGEMAAEGRVRRFGGAGDAGEIAGGPAWRPGERKRGRGGYQSDGGAGGAGEVGGFWRGSGGRS